MPLAAYLHQKLSRNQWTCCPPLRMLCAHTADELICTKRIPVTADSSTAYSTSLSLTIDKSQHSLPRAVSTRCYLQTRGKMDCKACVPNAMGTTALTTANGPSSTPQIAELQSCSRFKGSSAVDTANRWTPIDRCRRLSQTSRGANSQILAIDGSVNKRPGGNVNRTNLSDSANPCVCAAIPGSPTYLHDKDPCMQIN